MISCLTTVNASSCSGPQTKGMPLQVNCRSGSDNSAILGEYLARYWHMPKNVCNSVTLVGVGIWVMACTLSLAGLCPLCVIHFHM